MESRVLSGALHYFRVLPEQWEHRLRMLRAMGLDTVETYIAWNLHEPRPGSVTFDGIADLSRFLATAAEVGLAAIVRPGPYICAEWDNGGLPAWLTGRPGIRLRCLDETYLAAVDAWFDELIPVIAEHQVTRGGNVTMVQVENEYGSYGSDAAYLRHLADGLVARGIDVPLFTSDGSEDHMLTGGMVPGLLATVNFGSEPEQAFARLARHRPRDAPFCMEYWNGWFDHWGDKHVTRDAADAAGILDRILRAGASVNIYMAHGGTNFGTWAGANREGPVLGGKYQPDVTSYDYDAPIDERGGVTPKFWAFREVLARYAGDSLPEPPPAAPLLAPSSVTLTESVPLRDVLNPPVSTPNPPTFEELGLTHGVVLYGSTLPGPRVSYPLTVDGLADRAHLLVDGVVVAVLDESENSHDVEVPGASVKIELLVESMGRTNYGPHVGERKGITGGVRHGQQYVHGWSAYPLDLSEMPEVRWGTGTAATAGPGFHRGVLTVTEPGDAWLAVPEGNKGYIWVNGFGLGRYWNIGPQRALYLPWPVLRRGSNEVVVLELDLPHPGPIAVRNEPDLG